jgi:hypothetical protein
MASNRNPESKLRVPFSAPLNLLDSETQTQGCRHTNPDICGSNSLDKVCAFVRDDGICLKPSASWKKQYNKLKVLESGKE